MTKFKNIILAFLVVVSSMQLIAQENLSLKDAIELSLANNYGIQIAKKNIAIAKNNNNWGEAGRYPSIGVSAAQTNRITDQSKNPTAFIKDLVIVNGINAGIDLNWTIFNGFGIKATKSRLEEIERQSEGNAAVVIENTIQSVVLAYNNALLQKDKLTLLRSVFDLSSSRYDRAILEQEIGTASSLDVLQFENAYITDSTNLILQQLGYDVALQNLNRLMAVDPAKVFVFTDQLGFKEGEYELDDLKEKLNQNNNTLKNQYINLALRKAETKLARSQKYPTLSLGAGASYDRGNYKVGDNSLPAGTNLNYYANLSLSFNLFNGGKVKRALSNSLIQEEIANLNIEDMKTTINNGLANTYSQYNARKKVLNLNKVRVLNAQKSLEIAEQQLNAGVINSFDYRDVQISFLTTGISALEATYNLIDTHTELTRLTGGLIEEK